MLAFTRSKIFEVYYFRIWLALVIVAASHALIFLPVALSWAGGEGYMPVVESGGGLESDLWRRRDVAVEEEMEVEFDSDEESLRIGRR